MGGAQASESDEIVAAAREVAALFRDHPFVPRTWVEVQRFVDAVAAGGPQAAHAAEAQMPPDQDQDQDQHQDQASAPSSSALPQSTASARAREGGGAAWHAGPQPQGQQP